MNHSFILFIRYQENHILENASKIPQAPANVAIIPPLKCNKTQPDLYQTVLSPLDSISPCLPIAKPTIIAKARPKASITASTKPEKVDGS